MDRDRKAIPGLSIALLNRGGKPFRKDLFKELESLGAREVISVETPPYPYDVEALSRVHDRLRFVLFSRPANAGIRVDVAVHEAACDHVFVLWNDMKISANAISSRVFVKIAEREQLCVAPNFLDAAGRPLPTAMTPLPGRRRSFDVQPMAARRGETPTLLPWDYSGIYRKDKHRLVGGYDGFIEEPYWQKMDYGLRSWLWGETLTTHPALKVGYVDEPPTEDASSGPGYRRFFLKNLAVRFRGDSGSLPLSRFLSYRRAGGESREVALERWRDVRRWVFENRYRFRRDAASLAATWDWEDGD